jgi:hypothetical protein
MTIHRPLTSLLTLRMVYRLRIHSNVIVNYIIRTSYLKVVPLDLVGGPEISSVLNLTCDFHNSLILLTYCLLCII